MNQSDKGLLVVVTGGPENLIGKTGYWNSEKTVFGRQDLFEMFGDFHGLNLISREHLQIKIDKYDLVITDNDSTHGSKIETHPYSSWVDERELFRATPVLTVDLSNVLQITIGRFWVYTWGGSSHHRCEYCNIPLEWGDICRLCSKAKCVNSVVVETFDKEKLVAKLQIIHRQDGSPDGFPQTPGLVLVRNGEEFQLTISEVQKIADLLKNEFSYHHRMCSEYHDLT